MIYIKNLGLGLIILILRFKVRLEISTSLLTAVIVEWKEVEREVKGLAFVFPRLIEIKDSARVAFDLVVYIAWIGVGIAIIVLSEAFEIVVIE